MKIQQLCGRLQVTKLLDIFLIFPKSTSLLFALQCPVTIVRLWDTVALLSFHGIMCVFKSNTTSGLLTLTAAFKLNVIHSDVTTERSSSLCLKRHKERLSIAVENDRRFPPSVALVFRSVENTSQLLSWTSIVLSQEQDSQRAHSTAPHVVPEAKSTRGGSRGKQGA